MENHFNHLINSASKLAERSKVINKLLLNTQYYFKYCFPHIIRKIRFEEFPKILQIETHSYCNGFCTCCPYGKIKVNMGKMGWALYKKIIDEASNYKVDRISLYMNNEPTLDKELVRKVKYAKKKNPNANIHISTNASMLTKKVALGLVNYLDSITFSVQGGPIKESYEKCMIGLNFERCMNNIDYLIKLVNTNKYRLKIKKISISNVIKSLSTFKTQQEYWGKRGVHFTKFQEFTSRASSVFQIHSSKKRKLRGCNLGDRPLRQTHILFNGDVVLCCMDWERKTILGNVKNQSIYEIWNGEKYNNIRDMIYYKKGVKNNFLCNKCEKVIK